MKYAMVDIETLSTQPDAAVISIGMVGFNDFEVEYSEGIVLRSDDWYGHIDPETVKWWSKQDQIARDYSFHNPDAVAAFQAASRFRTFAEIYGKDEVWANGPQFDLVILRKWWEDMPLKSKPTFNPGKFPIHYRTYRDCRTLWDLAKSQGHDLSSAWSNLTHVAHNPVDDAAVQARAVILARSRMGASRND